MGLFTKNKEQEINNSEFFSWLDNILMEELPSEIKAINFNLYEDENDEWSIELVGTDDFDEDDNDWACDEVYTTRDNPFVLKKKSDWQEIETLYINLVKEYINTGKYADKLKFYVAIGIGFVDGDLNVIYRK